MPAIPNVYPLDHPHLRARELKDRGWTETMITRFLGAADRMESVDHWANFTGARAWALDRVERVESTMAFEEFFITSARRRKLPEAMRKKVLQRIRKFRREGRDLQPPLEASFKDRMIAEVVKQVAKRLQR